MLRKFRTDILLGSMVDIPISDLPSKWRPEPTITLEAKAWLKSLSCRKAKELGYPHELWTTRLLARHAREHGPAEGHLYLANTKMTVARVAARLVLRRFKGRGRKSSPSSVRMSNVYGWTSSSCLRECRTLKSGTPSSPRMTASAQHRGQREEFSKRLRRDRKQPDQIGGGLQNQVRDFNGLARKPLCYRYTIPQNILRYQ
jgi:hypothetical protein